MERAGRVLHWPAVAVGWAATLLVVSSQLFDRIPDVMLQRCAIGIGLPTLLLFLWLCFNASFQGRLAQANAVSQEAFRSRKGVQRLRWALWPPFGDRGLLLVNRVVLAATVIASFAGSPAASQLGFAAFAFVTLNLMAQLEPPATP